jgi:hypothetical protein
MLLDFDTEEYTKIEEDTMFPCSVSLSHTTIILDKNYGSQYVLVTRPFLKRTSFELAQWLCCPGS